MTLASQINDSSHVAKHSPPSAAESEDASALVNGGDENSISNDTFASASATSDAAIDEQLHSLSVSSSLDAISEGEQQQQQQQQNPKKEDNAGVAPDASFKAKKAPASTRRPSVQPQLSRAAMLRMGITPPPKRTLSRDSVGSSETSKENVLDSHQQHSQPQPRSIPTPKSLATPKIQVRQSRASHLRRGSEVAGGDTQMQTATPTRRRTSSTPVDYTNTPGHRRSSLVVDVASIRAPSITPRQTRASRLRAGSEAGESRPPSSTSVSRKSSTDTFADTPGHKRTLSIPVKSINSPAIAARQNRSSELRAKRMSVDLRNTPQKPAFNLSTRVDSEKFVDFDKKKVKPIRRDSGVY
ncbi:hypothetical protein E3P99_01560 [Wallemia hederae]|uniref:Uncharacterized protein n=1 Tax=Wallemia hederae TaxID=1540922 RepID=A0A4T0FPG3_9BASI|nr:hypothetical protein E3P99_01560 [Wallemia hederae]